jgi:hypothetical protein
MRCFVLVVLACCGSSERASHVAVAHASTSTSVAAVTTCPPYATHAAPTATPDLPAVATLSTAPLKIGDAFTVRGAVHALNARERDPRLDQPITIVGVIVDTNLARAPKCAVHKTGRADPPNCVAEIPAFTLADDADAHSPRVRALGWASNFANVYEAFLLYRGHATAPARLYQDELWAGDIPFPLPAPGARVRVTGRYGANFMRGSNGLITDADFGIITVDKVEMLERAPTPATF